MLFEKAVVKHSAKARRGSALEEESWNNQKQAEGREPRHDIEAGQYPRLKGSFHQVMDAWFTFRRL